MTHKAARVNGIVDYDYIISKGSSAMKTPSFNQDRVSLVKETAKQQVKMKLKGTNGKLERKATKNKQISAAIENF